MKPLGDPTKPQRNLQLSWQTLMAFKPQRTEQHNTVALLLLHRGRCAIPPVVRAATINATTGKLELVTSGVVAGGLLAWI